MDETLVQFAADSIRHYLRDHPQSADTLEGIHQWWIVWPGLPEAPGVTATALVRLERAALVERRRVGNREIWRLARPAEGDGVA